MANLNAKYIAKLSDELNAALNDAQSKRRMTIPSYARMFFESVITESLIIRSQEWSLKNQINVGLESEVERTIFISVQQVKEIAKNANTENIDGMEYLSLIAIIDYIKKHWCGVFPFCR